MPPKPKGTKRKAEKKPQNSDTEGTEEEDSNKRPARARKQSTRYQAVDYITPTKNQAKKDGYVILSNFLEICGNCTTTAPNLHDFSWCVQVPP